MCGVGRIKKYMHWMRSHGRWMCACSVETKFGRTTPDYFWVEGAWREDALFLALFEHLFEQKLRRVRWQGWIMCDMERNIEDGKKG